MTVSQSVVLPPPCTYGGSIGAFTGTAIQNTNARPAGNTSLRFFASEVTNVDTTCSMTYTLSSTLTTFTDYTSSLDWVIFAGGLNYF